VESQMILHVLIKGLSISTKSKSRSRKSLSPRSQQVQEHYFKILKLIDKALKTYNYFDILKSLFFSLELFEGTLALAKGPRVYKRFQLKYNSSQYDMLWSS